MSLHGGPYAEPRVLNGASLWIGGVLVVQLMSACNDADFSGATTVVRPTPAPGVSDVLPTSPPVDNPTPSPRPTPPVDNCRPGTTITNVRSLTGTVNQMASSRKLVYELSLYDCPGTVPQTVVQSVYFDVDAHTAGALGPLPFSVVNGGAVQSRGFLSPVQGSDLFGKTGQNYWHHRSNQTISISAERRTVVFEVDISDITIVSPIFGNPAPLMTIPTYFKFGPAQPVRVNIQVTEGDAGWGLL